MRNITRLFVFISIWALTGCGNVNLNVGGLTPVISTMTLSTSAEFVASSQQGLQTVNSFNVNASSGENFSQMAQVTQHGYTVFTTVQGEFASDQIPAGAAASAAAAMATSSSVQ